MASAHKVILIAVVVLLPRSSQAQRTIAIEFYDGQRPDDADEHVGPVLDELGAQGAITGAAVGRSYEDTVSRSGSVVDPAALAAVPTLADEGFRAWTEARFGDAVELL